MIPCVERKIVTNPLAMTPTSNEGNNIDTLVFMKSYWMFSYINHSKFQKPH